MLHTSCWQSARPPSSQPELRCGRQVMEGLAQWVRAGMLAQPQARAAALGLFAALGALFHAEGERPAGAALCSPVCDSVCLTVYHANCMLS